MKAKLNKITAFIKKHIFYVGLGVVSVGALTAVFLLPNREGNVKDNPNPYAAHEAAGSTAIQDLEIPDTPVTITDENVAEEVTKENGNQQDANTKEQVVAETFESTTADNPKEVFFAEGDTMVWPVVGQIVVPYTDDTTKHWFSTSLNQTMRTFGICIATKESEDIKAVADGTVVDILDDSSSLSGDMPYVGKAVVLDHGNGYKSIYGFQNGTPNKDLLGKVVKAGEVIGQSGKPAGAFINEGNNIYVQVTHNDKIMNPLDILEHRKDLAESQEGVDLGYLPNDK